MYSVLAHGDEAVLIAAEVAETSTGTQETLATFVGNGLVQNVGLSRGLNGEEVLLLIHGSNGEELAREPVRDAGTTYINARVGSGEIDEGATVVFSGTNVTGTESVALRLRKAGEPWTAATVTAFSNEELALTVPDLGLEPGQIDKVEIRISDGAAELFFRSYYIRGQ